MRQEKTNTWKDGLNLDLHPMVTPNTVLTDCLNGTFITYDGNEFCLQNNRGNTDTKARLSEGFYPLGIKEHNGVLYIVSINNENVVEIGTYPGLNWNILLENIGDLNYKLYSPLYNLFSQELVPIKEIFELSLTEPQVLPSGAESFLEGLGFDSAQISNFCECIAPLEFDDDADCSECAEVLYGQYNIQTIESSHWEYEEQTVRVKFRTTVFNFDKNHPVTIEIQDSYDGSVNIIMTDGVHIPRIVNSGFSVLPNDKYKLIERNQIVDTNTYTAETLDKTAALIQGSTAMTKIDLTSVDVTGQLKGGNYTFYLKYGNEDGNTTDLIAQSGIVSIFKGSSSLLNIRGTIGEERTNKSINFRISNLDQGYSCFYLYYSREYCDTQGYSMYECKAITKPYKYSSDTTNITITGFEEITSISEEELNVTFHQVNSVKTMAQQQDMLFLGNITNNSISKSLQELSYNLQATIDIEDVFTETAMDRDWLEGIDNYQPLYANPDGIYYKLGYWFNEFYRFGIVYILNDGSTTDVFNIIGFKGDYSCENNNIGIQNKESFIDGFYIQNDINYNKYGVFSREGDNTLPKDCDSEDFILSFKFKFDSDTISLLKDLGVVGYQIVRQKRIPNTYCQALSIYTEKQTGIPLIPYHTNFGDGVAGTQGITESFITYNGDFGVSDYLTKYDTFKEITSTKTIAASIIHARPTIVYDSGIDADIRSDAGSSTTQWYIVYKNNSQWKIYNNEVYIISCENNWYCYSLGLATPCVYRFIGSGQYIADLSASSTRWTCEYAKNHIYNVYDDSWKDYLTQHIIPCSRIKNAAVCLDAAIIPEIRNLFNGDNFDIVGWEYNSEDFDHVDSIFFSQFFGKGSKFNKTLPITFVECGLESKVIDFNNNTHSYSTLAGDASSKNFKRVQYAQDNDDTYWQKYNLASNRYLVRGKFMPFLAIPELDEAGGIIDISRKTNSVKTETLLRANDNSPFYVVSDRISIDDESHVYRGDCYICSIFIRYNYNFIDSTAPTQDYLLKDNWRDEVYNLGANKTFDEVDWDEINLSDMNNVPLGIIIGYKCRSSYNLMLRSINDSDTINTALFGNPRSFYPYQNLSLSNKFKQEESWLQNDGYNKTVSRKRYEIVPDVPYIKSEYSNRVMFSNRNVNDGFINGYRTYQGLAYHDYDKQYGEIIKLLPWDNNLFCVFEHGCAILPINEKALMQTTTDQTIHIYGHGVLPDTMTIISSDYGSKFPDTVIRTPIGIYGLDCDAKKVWRFSKNNGFETLSDMKIESWLNDNIKSSYLIDVAEPINVRTEYNSLKGDVIISIHDKNNNVNSYHSITFNERQGLWVTKNNWGPVITENANGMMYSLPVGSAPGIYKHDSKANPTEWYGQIEPFEFEFVVSDPIGIHKIIDNLQIISNNCQPEELTFEIIGDSYMFNKEKLKHLGRGDNDDLSLVAEIRNSSDILNKNPDPNFPSKINTTNKNKSNQYSEYIKNTSKYKVFAGTEYEDDYIDTASFDINSRTKQYHLRIPQECRNIETWGRRIGNIYYSEDSWYTNVEPIRFDAELLSKNPSTMSGIIREARIRDKWCKIRVRYTGEDLAVISAIKTMINI